MYFRESELIYDWNRASGIELQPPRGRVELDDETLRDGLQSPSVRTPTIEEKLEILHLIADVGIDAADLGLPAAGKMVYDDVLRLAQEIVDAKLPIMPNAAARTMISDIEPIVEISQKTGIALEVSAFIGSSTIRQYAEGWGIDRMLRSTEEAVKYATDQGLPVMYVTEDTTRAAPDDLRRLYTTAVEAGAKRVCVSDTVGHSTPNGARSVIRFIRRVVGAVDENILVDWHGHRDRGLAVANALAAAAAGAARLHGTVLGVGERVGNTPIDQMLVNLDLLGWSQRDLGSLMELCRRVAETTKVPFPRNYPVFGTDAFRTATGVHAAAIVKARKMNDNWLADRVYSSVPASLVGCRQIIDVGPMSGLSNVVHWLQENDYPPDKELSEIILEQAKKAPSVLSQIELHELCHEHGVFAEKKGKTSSAA
jgi:2-isopropylmalate synthase